MPRLLVGNFDFEYSLGKRPPQQLSRKLEAVNARWLPRMLPLASRGDYVWLPEHIPLPADSMLQHICEEQGVQLVRTEGELPRGAAVEFLPWGWTAALSVWATRFGWSVQSPEFAVVAWANSRATSFDWEQTWECVAPGTARLDSLAATKQCLRSIPSEQRWVIKAEFGMSARERLLGQGANLQPSQLQWISRQFQSGSPVFFEPWLERIEECSLHYQLSPAGEVRLLGQLALITDPLGRYQENQLLPDRAREEWPDSVRMTVQAAQQIARRGYFGPLSFDCMRYLDTATGQPRERPLQDINARWTMGRCAWEAAFVQRNISS